MANDVKFLYDGTANGFLNISVPIDLMIDLFELSVTDKDGNKEVTVKADNASRIKFGERIAEVMTRYVAQHERWVALDYVLEDTYKDIKTMKHDFCDYT
jgi:hypothetical protein